VLVAGPAATAQRRELTPQSLVEPRAHGPTKRLLLLAEIEIHVLAR
jgi:hypothetical protein